MASLIQEREMVKLG